MLFTICPELGGVRIWPSVDAVKQFFPDTSADEARRRLGPDADRGLGATATPGLDEPISLDAAVEGVRGLTSGLR